MRRIKLTRYERQLEAEIGRGEWVPASKEESERIARIINARKKDAVLNLRVNRDDLNRIKQKAVQLGVKYQTFIAEHLHRLANT